MAAGGFRAGKPLYTRQIKKIGLSCLGNDAECVRQYLNGPFIRVSE